MSTFDTADLPPFVHYMQVIVLGCIIEAGHRARYQQHMQPDQARIQAMAMNVSPDSNEHKEMIAESFRVAVRLWKASRVLGMSFLDNRTIPAADLVMAGL